MTGRHRLDQLESLTRANLAHHDAVWTHSKRGLEEVADGDLSPASRVGRLRFHLDHVRELELELSGILDHHDPVRFGGERAEAVEERGLPRPSASRDDAVLLAAHDRLETLRRVAGHGAKLQELLDRQRVFEETPNRDARPVWRCGRDHRFDA